MLIHTLLGEIEEAELTKEEERTAIHCGHTVTTRYYFKDELVRQDTTVEVERSPALGSAGGLFSKGK